MTNAKRLSLSILLGLLAAACGDSGSGDAGTGDAAADNDAAFGDASMAGNDAGRDGGSTPTNDVGPEADAGVDSGATDDDSGTTDDDAGSTDVDAGVDSGTTDTDSGPAPTDGGTPANDAAVDSTPDVIALSATGHDRLYAVTFDAAGNIYATGQIASGIDTAADFSLLVAKFSPIGVPDTSFGTNGVATVNVTVGGRAAELARGIVVQSNGRIVIGATAEHDPSAAGVLANDTDIVLVGFLPTGALDNTFGTNGIVRMDLGTGVATVNASGNTVLSGADSAWGIALAANDAIVIHGATRASGVQSDDAGTPRTDTDYALIRRLANGAADTAFGTNGLGYATLDVGGVNAGARDVTVLPDNSVIGFGYTTATVLGSTAQQQPVLWKLTAAGAPDATFATTDATTTPGVWYDYATPAPGRPNAEAYGGARLSDGRLVTIGYGPTQIAGGMGTDLVSFRFSPTGNLDSTYATMGLRYVDVGGLGDNGRQIIALPGDRTLSVGGGRPMPATPDAGTPPQDGLVLVLTADGAPDTTFDATGFRLYNIGGADHFWGAALSPNQHAVAIVGIAGALVSGTDDDDSALLILPL